MSAGNGIAWKVVDVDAYGKHGKHAVYVRASTQRNAVEASHAARALVGLPRARQLAASEYRADLDPSFPRQFIGPAPGPSRLHVVLDCIGVSQ